MKILMLGNFNFDKYHRGRILYKSLKKINSDVALFYPKKNFDYLKQIKLLLKRNYDVLLVNGKIPLLLSLILKPIHKKTVVNDTFISDYDTQVLDRKIIKKNSLKAKLLRFFDKYSCILSNHNILETDAYIDFFVNEFNLNKKKFSKIETGADDSIFYPIATTKKTTVFFFGTFIPLQGIETIVKAAKLLENEKIDFKIVGKGQTYSKIRNLAKKLNVINVVFTGELMSEPELNKEINKSKIYLGIFGTSKKAKHVIASKIYVGLACKTPIITSDTHAAREILFNNKNAILVPPGNHIKLKEAILKLHKNTKLRKKVAKQGYKDFIENYSLKKIGIKTEELLKSKR